MDRRGANTGSNGPVGKPISTLVTINPVNNPDRFGK